MLALACDHRVMATGKAKMSLNEINFGSTVFAGSTEILRFWVGSAVASDILLSGAMYRAEEAQTLGLVQEVAAVDDVLSVAKKKARNLASRPAHAFASIKSLLRKPVADEMVQREKAAVLEATALWYSDSTRAKLKNIIIR